MDPNLLLDQPTTWYRYFTLAIGVTHAQSTVENYYLTLRLFLDRLGTNIAAPKKLIKLPKKRTLGVRYRAVFHTVDLYNMAKERLHLLPREHHWILEVWRCMLAFGRRLEDMVKMSTLSHFSRSQTQLEFANLKRRKQLVAHVQVPVVYLRRIPRVLKPPYAFPAQDGLCVPVELSDLKKWMAVLVGTERGVTYTMARPAAAATARLANVSFKDVKQALGWKDEATLQDHYDKLVFRRQDPTIPYDTFRVRPESVPQRYRSD